MPLVEAVLQQSRIDALTACDANLARYDPNSFLVIFRCRGRQMPFLIKPLLVLMIWSVAWLLIFERFEHFRDTIMPLEDLVTPLLTPVSFLLVFPRPLRGTLVGRARRRRQARRDLPLNGLLCSGLLRLPARAGRRHREVELPSLVTQLSPLELPSLVT